MGLDLKYFKSAFEPKFSEQKAAESLPFRVLHLTQSRIHLQEPLVAAAPS